MESETKEFNKPGHFEVVAIAASAGGLKAISAVLKDLPAKLPLAVLIVQHLHPKFKSKMAEILDRKTALRVKQAESGESIVESQVFVAPSDYHFLISDKRTVSLSHSEQVHFLRPAADLLFESISVHYKNRAIAVILTGTGSDGTQGAKAIKAAGGVVIAQSESSCMHFGMPSSVIQAGCVDWILDLDKIGSKIVDLTKKEVS